MRVVLDTNVFLSALLSDRGPPSQIVDAWRAEGFELVSSLDQIDEFKRVTRYPKVRRYFSRATVGRLVNGLRQAEVLFKRLPGGVDAPDPNDAHLIATAIMASADFLVTGDKALLSMKRIGVTPITTAQRFAAILAH